MQIKAGDTWDIEHSRKGALTVRFLQDAADDTEWIEGEIIEGKVKYMSDENRVNQRLNGDGTPGDKLTMRHGFVRFIKRRSDLEE